MVNLNEIKACSHEEWKEFGPLYWPERGEVYDGFEGEAKTTPNWPSLCVFDHEDVLVSSNTAKSRDPFTNAHGQWMKYAQVLSEGGEEALKLVRRAAKAADTMYAVSTKMRGNEDAWILRTINKETGLVMRGFIKMCGEVYPPAKGAVRQELPTKAEDLPIQDMLKSMNKFRPSRFRHRVMEQGNVRFAEPGEMEAQQDREYSRLRGTDPKAPKKPVRFGGVMAVFADNGMEVDAAEWASNLDKRLIVAPEKQGALIKELGTRKGVRDWYPAMYSPDSKQDKAARELVDRSDACAFFISHEGSRLWPHIAEASRQGKAVRIIDPYGAELDLLSVTRQAEAANMSKKEFAQSKTHHAFELSAADPWAHFGLSLVQHNKLGSFSLLDISKMAGAKVNGVAQSVNEVIEFAKNDAAFLQGQNREEDSPKLSASAIKLLANDNAMSAARQSLLLVRRETEAAGETIVGAADMPQMLLASGNFPPFLFAKGNLALLRDPGTIIGITGSQARDENDERRVAASASRAISSLVQQPVTPAYVQGQVPIDIPVTGPQIMIVTTGSAHAIPGELEKQQEVIDNGGVVIRQQPPVNRAYQWSSTTYNPKTKKKGDLVPVPAVNDRSMERRAAELLGAMSHALIVTDINAKTKQTPQHVAIVSALSAANPPKSADEKTRDADKTTDMRLPYVLDFSEYEGMEHTSGNRALNSNYGTKALVRAGFGAKEVQDLESRVENEFVAIKAGANLAAGVAKLCEHFTKNVPLTAEDKSASKQKQSATQEL